MPKPTIGFNVRLDPDVYERAQLKKQDLSWTKLFDLLLRAYVEGRVEVEAEKKNGWR